MSESVERRTFRVEVREADDAPAKIVGYAAKFNTESNELGWFREKILPGAFTKALADSDVRALWNHNSDYVLGRTKSGTLVLRQDDVGLWIEITPPDVQWARDLTVSIQRGDVDQMSFAFSDVTDRRTDDGDSVLRELLEIRKLYDVSPVTYPAYEDTEVYVRKLALGHTLTDAEKDELRRRIDAPTVSDSTSVDDDADNNEERSNDRQWRELVLAESY